MLKIDFSRQAQKFLKELQQGNPKHARQLAHKLQALRENPAPPDAAAMKGEVATWWRADAGEYCIVYRVEGDILKVAVIGKRNDAAVYRQLERKL